MKHKILHIIGISVILGTVLIWGFVFLMAYINSDKVVTIDINSYGEANFELVILIYAIVYCLYLTWKQIGEITN
jgi:uncharacterized membrane protein